MTQTQKENPWHIIVNPVSGGGKGMNRWKRLEKLLENRLIPFVVYITDKSGDASHFAEAITEKGGTKILVVGGDGTGNEAVNGIINSTKGKHPSPLFALAAAGTGNDWVRTHQYPKSDGAFLDWLEEANHTFQDIGCVHYQNEGARSRYFMNVAGMAYDGYIARMLEEKGVPTNNRLLYLFMIFRFLFKYKPEQGRIVFSKHQLQGPFYTINVGICNYSGGGMQWTPHAIFDDGKLALTVAGNVPLRDIFKYAPKFFNGTIGDHPLVDFYKTQEVLVEQGNEPISLEIDGEFIGYSPAKFSILPKALKILAKPA